MSNSSVRWPAEKIEMRPVKTLVPYARNARTHSDEQVAQIMASIREWGWTTPVLIDEESNIIAGHGRVMAAHRLGIESVPVVIARGWTKAQRHAYCIADNQLSINASWDTELLRIELGDLKDQDFNLSLLGIDESTLGLGDIDRQLDPETYTTKINIPTYNPTGERPRIGDLFDRSKADDLIAEITAHDIPDDLADFLRAAAQRHVRFNFRKIAEFYAHADMETQALFEKSALVIIDIKGAIANGFVKLTDALGAIADLEGFREQE